MPRFQKLVRMPPEMHDKLLKSSKELGMDVNAVIMTALHNYYKTPEVPKKRGR